MKKLCYIFALSILLSFSLECKEFIFHPLVANIFEARVGSQFQTNTEKIRLDIGASLDIYRNYGDTNFIYSIGADFFTLTRLRSAGRFKFPVETSDYFFGANFSAKINAFVKDIFFRVRIAHISSHLVDGFARDSVFYQLPFVYSKEFIDFVLAYQISFMRVYIGSEVIFSYLPKDLNLVIPQVGCDFEKEIFSNLQLVGGYDLKFSGTDGKLFAVHSAQIGIFITTYKNSGIVLNFNLFDGRSIHGMFYKQKDKYFAIGFEIIGI